jgi:hypothetical protein
LKGTEKMMSEFAIKQTKLGRNALKLANGDRQARQQFREAGGVQKAVRGPGDELSRLCDQIQKQLKMERWTR